MKSLDWAALRLSTAPGKAVSWPALDGGSLPAAAVAAAREAKGLLLLVAPDEQQAWKLEQALRFHAGDELPIRHFCDPETLPYDLYSPHPDLISDRLALLGELPRLKRGIVLITPYGMRSRLPPTGYLGARSFVWKVGDSLRLDEEMRRLARAGYSRVPEVSGHGEFAIRGSLLDVFPMGCKQAVRVDLFDDEIDSLRWFDVETQLSTDKVEEVRLLPTREVPLDEESIARFREAYRQRFPGDIHRSRIYDDVSRGIAPGGIEAWLPLFFDQTASLFDYLPDGTQILDAAGAEAWAQDWAQIEERHEQRRHDIERPVLDPAELYLEPTALEVILGGFCRTQTQLSGLGEDIPQQNLATLLQGDQRLLLVAGSPSQREQIEQDLSAQGVTPRRYDSLQGFAADRARIGICIAPLEQGCSLPGFLLLTHAELYGARPPVRQRRRASRDAESLLKDLSSLAVGAPIVHRDHGVGIYQGLTHLTAGGIEQEFLALEYAGGDKIYVPVTNLERVHRYTGAELDNPPLASLRTDRWSKNREKAEKRARDVAAELLEIQARRAAQAGQSIVCDLADYQRFASGFPFEETEDQSRAIEAVLDDLAKANPMDRIVCGDVGFGKTEVALRAAFVAAAAGYQVALVAPTTLLANQHLETFHDRFADFPIQVEGLSRLKTASEQKQLLEKLEAGKIDIIIGTHRLLQKDIRFKQLGLVIVDEEQRFGVRHKEALKSLRAAVDMLTLTATPIPRTLNMSLAGIRDMSVIATPPVKRLAVKTFVTEWEDARIHEACQRELRRGGQIYFLHNRVEDIEAVAEKLRRIVPEARIGVAHGQMNERALERIMLDFYHNRFNLLVSTTIIESGIDVPNANTILINRADRLGLAQLHQLRGRVGRSHHRAYCFLLVPPSELLTDDAEQRLSAIEQMTELGAGFQLATHDLEIRGAGELLGQAQSGQINAVGFTLYAEMLSKAVRALQRGELDGPLEDELTTEVELGTSALFPESYIGDVNLRLTLYKRLGQCEDAEAVDALRTEVMDRFGELPEVASALFEGQRLRVLAAPLQLERIEAGAKGVRIKFGKKAQIDPSRLFRLIQSRPKDYKLQGDKQLDYNRPLEDMPTRMRALTGILEFLLPRDADADS
ncbi:MAG: transcription-repair coupling factor [Oceanococcaceae bacterium]